MSFAARPRGPRSVMPFAPSTLYNSAIVNGVCIEPQIKEWSDMGRFGAA